MVSVLHWNANYKGVHKNIMNINSFGDKILPLKFTSYSTVQLLYV